VSLQISGLRENIDAEEESNSRSKGDYMAPKNPQQMSFIDKTNTIKKKARFSSSQIDEDDSQKAMETYDDPIRAADLPIVKELSSPSLAKR